MQKNTENTGKWKQYFGLKVFGILSGSRPVRAGKDMKFVGRHYKKYNYFPTRILLPHFGAFWWFSIENSDSFCQSWLEVHGFEHHNLRPGSYYFLQEESLINIKTQILISIWHEIMLTDIKFTGLVLYDVTFCNVMEHGRKVDVCFMEMQKRSFWKDIYIRLYCDDITFALEN